MSPNEPAQPAKPQTDATHDGVAAEWNDEALQNLAGFFDVLIQMDLESKQSINKEETHEN